MKTTTEDIKRLMLETANNPEGMETLRIQVNYFTHLRNAALFQLKANEAANLGKAHATHGYMLMRDKALLALDKVSRDQPLRELRDLFAGG